MGVSYAGRKNKGSKAERDLIHLFWANGFGAMRAAGSGSAQHPSPDVVAGNGRKFFAFECKSSHDKSKYLTKDEITQLDLFANSFGARAFVAIKFDGEEWYFLRLTDLKKTDKSYVVTLDIAKKKGLSFEELVR
ncbi:MAG: Holliday junction resolvase [Nanoarchaeota archaeon]|nr:Holliday junction resolvase [Nanoarchaeota archaeon]MBU1322391.1 Holliday junction resolvase [Nanoarchaeota archaeon]MBU1596934.1 Holliday junction resolvase [Nanoarchaeota archaeon]MBU2442349.1 Holliday junction resolvase [Nanoarchaeota archaeon]